MKGDHEPLSSPLLALSLKVAQVATTAAGLRVFGTVLVSGAVLLSQLEININELVHQDQYRRDTCKCTLIKSLIKSSVSGIQYKL